MILVIDNTPTAGTFFDNIHNTNLIVEEYEIESVDDIKNLEIEIPKSSKIYIKEDNIPYRVNEEVISSLKYDYINEDNVNEYRTPYFDKIFKTINDSFLLTKEQYNSWIVFQNEHIDCRVDKENGRHKFGSNGGGSSLLFQINYCSEEMFPRIGFIGAKCEGCEKKDPLIKKYDDIKDLDKRYESFQKYHFKFNLVEFYRFVEIYNEYKSTIEISWMGMGLGDLVSIKVKDYVFDITDNSHW